MTSKDEVFANGSPGRLTTHARYVVILVGSSNEVLVTSLDDHDLIEFGPVDASAEVEEAGRERPFPRRAFLDCTGVGYPVLGV